jgi:hypothetical protein
MDMVTPLLLPNTIGTVLSAPPPNTIDLRRIWGRVRVGVARLAQARQNRPGKGELDLTDIDLDRKERQPPFLT